MEIQDWIQFGILSAIAIQAIFTYLQFRYLKKQFSFEQQKLQYSFRPLLTIEVNFDPNIHRIGSEKIELDEGPFHKVIVTCHKATAFNFELKGSEFISSSKFCSFKRIHPIVMNPGDEWAFKLMCGELISSGEIGTISFFDSFNNKYQQKWTYETFDKIVHKLELPTPTK